MTTTEIGIRHELLDELAALDTGDTMEEWTTAEQDQHKLDPTKVERIDAIIEQNDADPQNQAPCQHDFRTATCRKCGEIATPNLRNSDLDRG